MRHLKEANKLNLFLPNRFPDVREQPESGKVPERSKMKNDIIRGQNLLQLREAFSRVLRFLRERNATPGRRITAIDGRLRHSPRCTHAVICLRKNRNLPDTATASAAMQDIKRALGLAISSLSDENYQQSFARCRLWLELEQTYCGLAPSDLIFDAIWENKAAYPSSIAHYPAAPLILRFVNEAESDPVLAPYSPGLRNRLCAMIMQEFIEDELRIMYNGPWLPNNFYMDANLIAHCVNHGYIEESAIRNHILQPLISHKKFFDHHAFALGILFKIAGATFKAYADPSVVDRCFELLEDFCTHDQQHGQWIQVGSPSIEGRWRELNKISGSDQTAGGWLEGPPSSTHIHDQ